MPGGISRSMPDRDNLIDAMKKAGKPLKTAEIVEISGLEKTTVTKLIKELKEEGTVISPKRCYYSLK